MDLVKQLEQFYHDDPKDPFNVYALALEYQKHDRAKASVLFRKLLIEHPDYVATYYHAAKLFDAMGNRADAISTFEKGIEVAKKVNDQKAARELKSAYDEMMFE
jgi:tetratricopeptide (TPR) repeat protein